MHRLCLYSMNIIGVAEVLEASCNTRLHLELYMSFSNFRLANNIHSIRNDAYTSIII